jgi:hypothetical protein
MMMIFRSGSRTCPALVEEHVITKRSWLETVIMLPACFYCQNDLI